MLTAESQTTNEQRFIKQRLAEIQQARAELKAKNREATNSKLDEILRAELKPKMEKKYGESLPHFEVLLNMNSGDLDEPVVNSMRELKQQEQDLNPKFNNMIKIQSQDEHGSQLSKSNERAHTQEDEDTKHHRYHYGHSYNYGSNNMMI